MLEPVDKLSDEDFDKEFEKMMSTPPEEIDSQLEAPAEETLDGSPEVQQAEPQHTEQPEEPQEELSTETPTAEGEPEVEVAKGGEVEDSPQEPELTETSKEEEPGDPQEPKEFSFDDIPRDQIIPKDINVNGMKVRATLDELEEGFKKGMNYTQKMQEIAPHRKNMNLMSENNLTTDDLNLLVEAKSGNKEALAKLLANAKVDPLELEPEESAEYTPKDYTKDVPNVELEQVKTEILADTEFSPVVETALQSMPEDLYEMVSSNAGSMKALYSDVKSGLYEKAMPEVLKQQALYGKTEPTLKTYLRVAEQFFEPDTPQPAKEPPATSPAAKPNKVDNKELNNKRKSAGTTPASTPTQKKSFIQEDLDKMDDSEFEKAFEKMVGRSISEYD